MINFYLFFYFDIIMYMIHINIPHLEVTEQQK